jgi:hypothetical protein
MQPQRDALGDGGASHAIGHHGGVLGQFGGEFGGIVRIDLARQHSALTSMAPRSWRSSFKMSTPIFCDRRTNHVASGPLKNSEPAKATIMQRTNLVQACATSG